MSFAVWLTGLSGSGKSSIARSLLQALHERGVPVSVLESDVMRTQLTPFARYDEAERDLFYDALAELGARLCAQGRAVVLDATANRRRYRDAGRSRIARFCEVHVDTPLEACRQRDPKGLYQASAAGAIHGLPGAQAAYEAPLSPEVVVHGDRESPSEAAARIVGWLDARGWLNRG